MIEYKEETRKVYVPSKVVCDVCGEEQDSLAVDELTQLDFYAGYASVFGDMNHIQCDICHKCLYKMIKDYCRVNENECNK